MANFLDSFASLAGDILRPNRFKLKIHFPSIIGADNATNLTEVFAINTEIPSKTLGILEVPIQGGHVYKQAGDTTVPDWSVTLIADADMTIYRALQRWSEFCNSIQTGIRTNDLILFGGAEVQMLDGANQTVQMWEFVKIFPTEVGNLTLSKEEKDSFSQFDVNFSVNDIITNLV